MNPATAGCPFCQPEHVLFENELAYAIADTTPVNPGHLLIIPKRHVSDFFHTTVAEKNSLFSLLDDARCYLEGEHAPDGFNIGINIGVVAGQTIFHVHLHLIPRYKGDTSNPRGGVRGVIPAKQSY